MPIAVTCPRCNERLTFYDSQAGTIASCPFCTIEVHVPRRDTESITTAPADRENISHRDGDLSAGLEEIPTLEALPDDKSSQEEPLELGPRWCQVERAFSWVRTGVALQIAGLSYSFVVLLLSVLSSTSLSLPVCFPSLILGPAGIFLLIGYLMCLRIPAGTRARPAAVISLTARILAFGLYLYGALLLWDAKSIGGSVRDETLFAGFALLLGGWALTLIADFCFLALLRRVGLFLENRTVIRHVRLGVRILEVSIFVALLSGAVGYMLTYPSVLEEMSAYNRAFGMVRGRMAPDSQPFTWLLSGMADAMFGRRGAIPRDTTSSLIIPAVYTLFSIALGMQYLAALNGANATIKAGLERVSRIVKCRKPTTV